MLWHFYKTLMIFAFLTPRWSHHTNTIPPPAIISHNRGEVLRVSNMDKKKYTISWRFVMLCYFRLVCRLDSDPDFILIFGPSELSQKPVEKSDKTRMKEMFKLLYVLQGVQKINVNIFSFYCYKRMICWENVTEERSLTLSLKTELKKIVFHLGKSCKLTKLLCYFFFKCNRFNWFVRPFSHKQRFLAGRGRHEARM